MEFLQDLNPPQKEAVFAEDKLICVIAGPGCGKTKTLISRIIYLLTVKKVNSQNILVLTFAKKAIKEIRKRIYPYINPLQKSELTIANFHSFCYQVLSKYAYLLGFSENKFPIYDRHDQENIIKKIIYNFNEQVEQKEISTVLSLISYWKNCFSVDPLELDKIGRKRYLIYQKYQEYLQQNQALDFNDLLLYTLKIFHLYPQVKKEYQERFSHVLVDEFQDVNHIQNDLLEKIVSEEQNLFLVGDPNQAIYGFQGSTSELIFSLVKNDKWKIIYLNINYRSGGNIVDLANSFIKKNQSLLINNYLITTKESGEKIIQLKKFFLRSLIYQLRQLLIKERLQFSDVAFIYRNNYLSAKIEQELIFQKIPYEILGAFKFIAREEIKDILAFLRATLYQDNLSCLRILNLLEGIGSRSIQKIEEKSAKQEKNTFEYLNKIDNLSNPEQGLKLSPQQQRKILEFIMKINNFKEDLNKKKTLNTFLNEVLKNFAYWEHLETKNNHLEKRKNVQQFLNIAQSWEKKRKAEDKDLAERLNAFLQYFMIVFEDRKLIKSRNNLILSSIHQVKGLEFEAVFFIYLDEGTLPYKETKDLIEEKRLFYVGITRAKKILYLISSKYEANSSFLEEIDKSLIKIN